MTLNPLRDDDWIPPWTCQYTGKWQFTFAPDFSGFDPDTGELWSPAKIVEILGLKVADSSAAKEACVKVIAAFPKEAQDYKTKPKLIGFFIKKVLDETNNQANPKEITPILKQLLEE